MLASTELTHATLTCASTLDQSFNEMKTVTVIMPTIGRKSLIGAVNSVCAQDYPDIELIVCNDSGQNIPELSGSFFSGHGRSGSILSTSGKVGACAARNLGIHAAKGEYMTFLDDDDEMLPDYISRLSTELQGYRLVAGEVLTTKERPDSRRKGFLINSELIRCFNFVGNSLIAHTEDVRALGGFDTKLPSYQDYDLWLRLIDHVGPCLKVRKTGVLWNYCSDVASITNSSKAAKGATMFIDKHSETLRLFQRVCQYYCYTKYLGGRNVYPKIFDKVLSGISRLRYG